MARRKAHLSGLDAAPTGWIASTPEPRNALRRATATFFLVGGPFFRVLGAFPLASLANPGESHPAGFPAFARTTSSRAIAADPHSGAGRLPPTTRVQEVRPPLPAGAASRSVQRRLMRTPLTEQDGREYGEDGNFVKNEIGTFWQSAVLIPPPSRAAAPWGGWIEASVQRASRRVGSIPTEERHVGRAPPSGLRPATLPIRFAPGRERTRVAPYPSTRSTFATTAFARSWAMIALRCLRS